MIFFTSDLHFGHSNIIQYEHRPFADVNDMDKALIANWNSVVGKHDTVFVLGDISFYGHEKTEHLVRQLRGTKHLVMGNHDAKGPRWWMDVGFETASRYPIILDEYLVLQHKPPEYYNETSPYFYLYGHVHGTEAYQTLTKKSCCVCVERWKYTPVSFDQITAELSKLEIAQRTK